MLLRDRLSQALAKARRQSDQVAVLFVDLDRFETISGSLGHNIGDLSLQEVSVRFKACTRAQDTIARLGGDEFLILTAVKDIQGRLHCCRTFYGRHPSRIHHSRALPLHWMQHRNQHVSGSWQ